MSPCHSVEIRYPSPPAIARKPPRRMISRPSRFSGDTATFIETIVSFLSDGTRQQEAHRREPGAEPDDEADTRLAHGDTDSESEQDQTDQQRSEERRVGKESRAER